MKQWHYSAASVPAVVFAWTAVVVGDLSPGIALLGAALIVWSSVWNGLDHPRFKGKLHPAAALIRGSGRIFYKIRTAKDTPRDDVHGGPSYCVEWCLLLGLLVVGLTMLIPPLAPWSWYWGVSVFLGTFSHVLINWMTPDGVPMSAVYNYFVHKEVWKRHTLNWFSTNSGAERFGAVPVLYTLTVGLVLAMFGLLGPIFAWLLGVSA